jgi:RNA recognition motif. (a.k.a. RRM, RBD, or RNP domain)
LLTWFGEAWKASPSGHKEIMLHYSAVVCRLAGGTLPCRVAAAATGAPADPLSEPPHGTEVFVGGMPRTATEAQLHEFLEAVGELHSVTLLADPGNTQQNRG